MTYNRVIVLANGEINDLEFVRRRISADDFIICADGGALHALAMGIQPDLVIGDMDSLPASVIERLQGSKAEFLRFPAEKDKSDLELALERAVALAPKEILLVGALGGGRFDQAIGNLLLLTIPLRAGIPARIIDERHHIYLTEQEITVSGSPGETVSLFSLTPEVENITTEGLKYPLAGETLYFASTRGLSNEFTGHRARITTGPGLMLVIVCRDQRNGF
ncbi:MAG: thiamine diphosphokinase [Dethiobacter sp.]|jgi:thiamine pyrophosphokinase|nr:thiamine diphosphokinase [Dethiobacter sp.]